MRQLTAAIALILTGVASTCLPAADLSRPEDKQLEYANGLMRLGLYCEAALEYGVFVKRFPQDPKAGSAAYWRAYAYYKYSTRSAFRTKAREAIADFQKSYPGHPMFNLGYFLLGEIAMEEALDLEDELGKLKRNKGSAAEIADMQGKFENACRRAYPEYTNFIKNTDLSKYASDRKALDDMTRRVVTAYYNIGQCLRSLGEFGDAIKVYQLLVTKPEFADWGRDEAQFMVAQTCFDWAKTTKSGETEKFKQAREEYKHVMFYGYGEGGRSEFSDDARLGEAWCLYEIGSTNDCRKLLRDNEEFFKQVYDQFKDNPNGVDARWVRSLWPDIYYLYGKTLFKDKQYEDAKGWFERVIGIGGDNPWKAEATRMVDECLAALEKDEKRTIATEEDARKTYELAYNKYLTGQRESAAADFERIWWQFKGVRAWAYRDYLLYYWGKSLYASGDDGRLFEAAAVFDYLSKLEPRNLVQLDDGQKVSLFTEALYWEGHSNWRLAGAMEEGPQKQAFVEAAILAFEGLAYITPYHPKTAETLLNVGNYHLKNKDYVRAGLAYHKMVTLFPDHPDRPKALVNLCYVYRALDRLDDVLWAASEFEQKYPTLPDVVRIIDLKGNAYFKRARKATDPEQAKAYYVKAAAEYSKLRPEAFTWLSQPQREREYGKIFANALFYAGFCYEKTGETDNAIEFYRAFVDMAPPSNTFYAEGFARCAQVYFDTGRYTDAVAVARPFVEGLESPQEKAADAVAVLVASLLKLAASSATGAEPDAAKATELTDEAVADAQRLYGLYRATPIYHGAYMTVAAAFREAGRFDDMLAAYKALDANQQLHLDRADTSAAEKRNALINYTQLLFEAGSAIADAADALAKQGADTKRFDVAAGDFLGRHLEQAKRILGRGKIPANYVDVYFRIADILKRAGASQEAAKALNKIVAVVPPDQPSFLKAYYERGNVWREGGNPERALASYTYVIVWADNANPAWKTYVALSRYQAGIALYILDKKDAAKEQFTTLINTFDKEEDTVIQNAVAQARERLKEFAQETPGASGGK